jgi:hypothetical protein
MTVGKPDTPEGKILALFCEGIRKTKPKRHAAITLHSGYATPTACPFIL